MELDSYRDICLSVFVHNYLYTCNLEPFRHIWDRAKDGLTYPIRMLSDAVYVCSYQNSMYSIRIWIYMKWLNGPQVSA